jgi:hypothetical protein
LLLRKVSSYTALLMNLTATCGASRLNALMGGDAAPCSITESVFKE